MGSTNTISEKRFSTINNSINNLDNDDLFSEESEKAEHNLIIHNVFFEWIISKVIKSRS